MRWRAHPSAPDAGLAIGALNNPVRIAWASFPRHPLASALQEAHDSDADMLRTFRMLAKRVGQDREPSRASHRQVKSPVLEEGAREAPGGCACGGGCPRCLLTPVRIHADRQSAEAARALDAQAYTVGQDIFFGEGRYRPDTTEGRRLLVHELVHTVQQSRGGRLVQRAPDAAAPVTEPQTIEQDTRALWRTRVNNAVRTMFSLSGPGLTSARVEFVEPAEFAGRVPASTMVETLLDLFMSPPRFSRFNDILRHNHMGLAGPTRLRQFIEQGIAAGSFTYSELDPVAGSVSEQTVTPRELIAESVGGITSVQGTRSGRRVVMPVPGDVETLVHEACHFYVSSNFRNRASQDPDRNLFRFRKYHLLMEGFAEYYARQVMLANRDVFGPLHIQAYQGEVETVWRLVSTMEEAAARAAYFQGDTAALDRLNQAIELNVQYYPLMVPPFMIP